MSDNTIKAAQAIRDRQAVFNEIAKEGDKRGSDILAIALDKIIAAAGLPEEWGTCQECGGNGTIWESPEAEQAAEDWTRSEPPTGDGYQIWETVSEGSPISPVFATPEELAQHMAGTRWGADKGSSVETWLKFINGPGWAPSMVMDANGIRSGADAAF